VTSDPGSNDGEWASASSGASHDDLGNTKVGRSLTELIAEIRNEKNTLDQKLACDEPAGTASQDADAFDPTQSHFDETLEQVTAAADEPDPVEAEPAQAAGDPPAADEAAHAAGPADMAVDADMSQAVSGIEAILQRFAAAERRRCEQQLADWKAHIKSATMVVIKKQVDAARAKWLENQAASEAKIAEQYQKLKALADSVARQKAQIQGAKKELEAKLAVADRLHTEFDEIRQVLDGQIGAIDALEVNDEPDET